MIHPLEEKTAVAAAQAQKRCGAPIWGHTEAGTMGMELLDILARENVDFSTVALGHLDRNPDEYYLLKLADRGIYIQFDGPGKVKYYPDSIRVALIKSLISHGWGEPLIWKDTEEVRDFDISRQNLFQDFWTKGWMRT